MNKKPLVSVIIPVYNRQNLIQRSIFSVLNQTYTNLEVIVIDDASDDCTSDKVKQISDVRLKCYRNANNKGPSASRNIGIKMAKGEFIAFQDSDDEWYPEKLSKQINRIMNSGVKTAAVYCGMEFHDYITGKKIGENTRETNFRKNFTSGSHLLTPANVTILIRKRVLDEVGYFDERLHASEDTELAIRVSRLYDYSFIAEPLVKVTRNHKQLMGNTENYILAKEIIIDKHSDYLSKRVLFETCKVIANYYILTKQYSKATEILLRSLNFKFKLKTLFLLGLLHFPAATNYLYDTKYRGTIPLSSGLKESGTHVPDHVI